MRPARQRCTIRRTDTVEQTEHFVGSTGRERVPCPRDELLRPSELTRIRLVKGSQSDSHLFRERMMWTQEITRARVARQQMVDELVVDDAHRMTSGGRCAQFRQRRTRRTDPSALGVAKDTREPACKRRLRARPVVGLSRIEETFCRS